MGILLTIGLFVVGFGALLGTFTVIGKFGTAGPVRASVLLLVLDVVAVAVAPVFDLWLWFVIQCLVTVIWFLFYPTDAFVTGGVAGPLVLVSGVVIGTLSMFFLCGIALFMTISMIGNAITGNFDVIRSFPNLFLLMNDIPAAMLAVYLAGAGIGSILFWRRIWHRWMQGIRALKAIDQRAR